MHTSPATCTQALLFNILFKTQVPPGRKKTATSTLATAAASLLEAGKAAGCWRWGLDVECRKMSSPLSLIRPRHTFLHRCHEYKSLPAVNPEFKVRNTVRHLINKNTHTDGLFVHLKSVYIVYDESSSWTNLL